MEEDHKRSRHQYEFVIHEEGEGEGGAGDELKGGSVEVLSPDRKKRRTFESLGVESADASDTIGGLPVEMAHMIMSFAGMRELLSVGRTSKTHRELLKTMMGRGHETDSSSTMHLRWRTYGELGFLVNGECVISFEKDPLAVGYRMYINDVRMKENPIGTNSVTVISPSIVRSHSNDTSWMVDGYRLKRYEMREHTSSIFMVLKKVYIDDDEDPLNYHDYTNEYGNIRVYDTVKRDGLLDKLRSRGHPKYEEARDLLNRFVPEQDLTCIVYPYRGILASRVFNMEIIRAILINEESMLFGVASDDGNLIEKRDRKTGRLSWSVSVGAMELESACEIVNGIILFSVIHPIEFQRTVFAVERGPVLKSFLHLTDACDSPRKGIVRAMAYHNGIIAMVLGSSDDSDMYDKVIALDILEGKMDEWDIDAYGYEGDVTQAKGLQFMIGREYIRVVRV